MSKFHSYRSITSGSEVHVSPFIVWNIPLVNSFCIKNCSSKLFKFDVDWRFTKNISTILVSHSIYKDINDWFKRVVLIAEFHSAFLAWRLFPKFVGKSLSIWSFASFGYQLSPFWLNASAPSLTISNTSGLWEIIALL